jgi:hypothetical protein
MRLRLVLAGALALLATGCGKVGPAPPPVLVEASQVEPQIYWASDLNRRRVSIDGYIGFDNGPAGQAIAIGQVLTTRPNGQGDELMRFDLENGSGPNQLDLAVLSRERFVPNAPETITFDLAGSTFQDSAGKPHPLRQKVRVTGRLVYFGVGGAGLIADDDSRSPTGKRFKPRLVDLVLETPPGN